jgi:hypothetical protein
MTEYKIERFDSILNCGTSNTALPVIYIKTDPEFLEFAKKNNYIIGCKIKNSGTIYEDKVLPGMINNNVLNRPNFFKQTGLCGITLFVKWNGYPEYGSTPTVTFFGLNEDTNTQTNTQINTQTNTQNTFNNLKQKVSKTSMHKTNYINILKITSPTIMCLGFLSIVYFVKNNF